MTELLNTVDTAQWVSGRSFTPGRRIPFGGPANNSQGFALLRENASCEDGRRRDVLFTHPRWQAFGAISGSFLVEIPEQAVLRFSAGFLEGAAGSDGVTFAVDVQTESGVFSVWSFEKSYDRTWVDAQVDLSYWAGQRATITLRVFAGPSSGQDWAAWSGLIIEQDEGLERARRWHFAPTNLTVLDRTERSGGGDDPFLATLHFRSGMGVVGSTQVTLRDNLTQLAQNMKASDSILIPASANLAVDDVVPASVNSLSGFFTIAFEEDRRGRGTIRRLLRDLADDLQALLTENFERRLDLGALADGAAEIFAASGGGSSFGGRFQRWIGRGHDLIGANGRLLLSGDWAGDEVDFEIGGIPARNLENSEVTLEFAGDGGVWEITNQVSQIR